MMLVKATDLKEGEIPLKEVGMLGEACQLSIYHGHDGHAGRGLPPIIMKMMMAMMTMVGVIMMLKLLMMMMLMEPACISASP